MAVDFPSSPTIGQTVSGFTWDGTGWFSGPAVTAGMPTGSIMQWGTNTAPANWLICDGSAVSRSAYATLFSVIGTQFGVGDGSTTFNLPDLRGRVAVGKNSGTFGTLGATGGAESVTLTANQSGLREHSHSLPLAGSGSAYGVNDAGLRSNGGQDWNFRTQGIKTLGANYGTGDISQNALEAHTNLQPYQVLNYIIKTSAALTPGDSELATRVGAVEAKTNTLPISQNYVINGALDIWQRGTSFSTTGYTADRWYSPISGTAPVSRETANLPAGFQYGIKLTTGAASSFAQFNQAIETANVIPLQGQIVTASGWVKISGPYSGNWSFDATYSTSSDAYSSQTTQVPGSAAVIGTSATTTWTRFSKTFTVPSNAVGLRLEHYPDVVQPSGVTVTMTGMQLELGSTASSFRRNSQSIQGELAACQRYYWRNTATAYTAFGLGYSITATGSAVFIPYPVPMRSVPSLVEFSNLIITDSSTYDLPVTAIGQSQYVGATSSRVQTTHLGSAVALRPCTLSPASGTTGYIGFSAEL